MERTYIETYQKGVSPTILLETTEEMPGRTERTDCILHYMHSPDPRIRLPCFPPRSPWIPQWRSWAHSKTGIKDHSFRFVLQRGPESVSTPKAARENRVNYNETITKWQTTPVINYTVCFQKEMTINIPSETNELYWCQDARQIVAKTVSFWASFTANICTL